MVGSSVSYIFVCHTCSSPFHPQPLSLSFNLIKQQQPNSLDPAAAAPLNPPSKSHVRYKQQSPISSHNHRHKSVSLLCPRLNSSHLTSPQQRLSHTPLLSLPAPTASISGQRTSSHLAHTHPTPAAPTHFTHCSCAGQRPQLSQSRSPPSLHQPSQPITDPDLSISIPPTCHDYQQHAVTRTDSVPLPLHTTHSRDCLTSYSP